MKALIKRLREFEGKDISDEQLREYETECACSVPSLLDHIEKLEEENESLVDIFAKDKVNIKELEATIAKHERREDSHVKRIEELISSKGIKELEAVAEAAKELHEWIIDKALICPDKRLAAALKEAGYLK